MKTIIVSITISLLLVMGNAFAEYTVDSNHAQVGFKVTHLGILPLKGSFGDFNIEIDFDKKGKLKALKGTAMIDSIDTDNEKRDAHLKNQDFFHAEKYPDLSFEMTSYKGDVSEGEVIGKLTMRGVTKEVVLSTKISEEVKNSYGKFVRSVHLTGSVNRMDFNVGEKFGKITISKKVMIDIAFELIKK